MKVKIKTDGFKATQILLDDKDISHRVVGTKVNLKGGYVPTVTLELIPKDIEIEGDFDVFKDVPKLCCVGDYENKEIMLLKGIDSFEKLAKSIAEKMVQDESWVGKLAGECSRKVDSNNNIVISIDGEIIGNIMVEKLREMKK